MVASWGEANRGDVLKGADLKLIVNKVWKSGL